jgi:protein-tyrosine phosphatase
MPQLGKPSPVNTRVPKLVGGLNFRDMGGYATIDGRYVRWNKLYRSGTTHAITSEDMARIASYGIRFAFDLRSNTERRRHRSKLDGVADIEYRFLDHDKFEGDLTRYLQMPNKRPEQSRALMVSLYQKLPYEFREAYRALFAHLANGDLPLVFNCTAGKDRTGVAAAFVLTVLGVPRETVIDDYVLTEKFFDQSCEMILRGNRDSPFAGVDREIWEPLMRADAAYLRGMFDELAATNGSVYRYLEDQLGLTHTMIERIRVNLLD